MNSNQHIQSLFFADNMVCVSLRCKHVSVAFCAFLLLDLLELGQELHFFLSRPNFRAFKLRKTYKPPLKPMYPRFVWVQKRTEGKEKSTHEF